MLKMLRGDTTTNTLGKVKISTEAIATIASLSAQKVEGVAGMHKGIFYLLGEALGRKSEKAGVRVLLGDKEVWIQVFIDIKYGADVPEVAVKVQERIREAVESMTGLAVTEVDVSVRGISN
ncbi:MAG: Asp23/Gls24 family envelope stress response protein [Candidatus Firestonebacteria bacterium]